MSDGAQRAAERMHTNIESNLRHIMNAGGLKWSPSMTRNQPHADWLVVDERGVEYTLEIDVHLYATGKTHQQEGNQ